MFRPPNGHELPARPMADRGGGELAAVSLNFDLAIVAAVLAAQGIFRAEELRRTALLGEVGLDGRLRPVRGVLPATLAAQQAGFTG